MARSSAIQRMVPDVCSPAMRSITGASAEMRIGIGTASTTSIGLCTRYLSFSTSTGPGPANAAQHFEVVAHERGRALVREAELILDDPVVRRPEPEREPAAARDLGRERLLRHRDRVTRLDRHDRGTELDALGHLAETAIAVIASSSRGSVEATST